MDKSKSPMAKFDLETAIRLRWVLRDIKGARSEFLPVSKNDQTTLVEMGFVKIQDGLPTLTPSGSREIA